MKVATVHLRQADPIFGLSGLVSPANGTFEETSRGLDWRVELGGRVRRWLIPTPSIAFLEYEPEPTPDPEETKPETPKAKGKRL